MTDHKVVGPEEWQAARNGLLQREKAHPDGGRDEGDAFQSWIRRHDEYV